MVLILDISVVPIMDATGLVALESALERMVKNDTLVILVGAQPQPKKLLEKAGIKAEPGEILFVDRMREAVAFARRHMGEDIPPEPSSSTPISSWMHQR